MERFMFGSAAVAMLVLPVLALVCLVLGLVKHGRLSERLYAAALVAPLFCLVWALWWWFFSATDTGGAPVLFFVSLAVALTLSAAVIATRRGWRGSRVLTILGLGIPGAAAVPMLLLLVALALNAGME
jgi:hypothetical protein